MTFQRKTADKWQREVPGARWFKADLHIHTADDHPGKRIRLPDGVSGPWNSPAALSTYARRFLQALVKSGVQVAGLTPHSPRAGPTEETSAVWRIVEEWNGGVDDDGIPFREKVYAVFPGFEPSLNDGREGLHILFLFDPEIGRERYLRAFDTVMGGISPWRDGSLRMSTKDAAAAFEEMRNLRERESPVTGDGNSTEWDYLVLAPHIDASKGLLGAQKAQVLELFDHGDIAGLELSDQKMPEDATRDRPWLTRGMDRHRQAFFHASDAYSLDDIGRRHTWTKLARPRIEGLRQAFIAHHSRLRIGFDRNEAGVLRPIDNPPDVTVRDRPWLREVTIRGGASFFGGRDGDGTRQTRFRLSPDLTCVIGGSMTGKSTFLDGLRVHTEAALPESDSVRAQVTARGGIFAAGSPDIELDCPGRDPSAPALERWPARFFAQNELQRLAQIDAGVEDILARLIPSEIDGIRSGSERMRQLDHGLSEAATRLDGSDDRVADAEQAHQRARNAAEALATFAEAGVDRLHRMSRIRRVWEDTHSAARSVLSALEAAAAEASGTSDPPKFDETAQGDGPDPDTARIDRQRDRVVEQIGKASDEARRWARQVRTVLDRATRREADLRSEVQDALSERGHDVAKLREVRELTRQAALLPRYEDALAVARDQKRAHENNFEALLSERHNLVRKQRAAFDRVASAIAGEFAWQIRVRRVECGDVRPLEKFLMEMRQRGVTRWWNDLPPDRKASPERLAACLDSDTLDDVGMSSAVQETFRESMTRSRRRRMAALRCPDRYFLELRVDDGGYRRLDELSGGQRVGVLLTLLLETIDDRPLVIDQPEDELDNRFLFDTVLPALRKLRARRQVIVATHNANFVVNGDADMVLQLEATAHHGRVAAAGTIEDQDVRAAIVRTVDGGEEAFRLRRRKYGF